MTDFNLSKRYLIYIFFLLILQPSTPYQILSLGNNHLCSSSSKQKITLGLNTNSGLIISLANVTKLSQHTIDLKKDFVCEFQVATTGSYNGLFVVIQDIVFRLDEQTNDCIDYVELKRNNVSISRRYCEVVNNDYSNSDVAINLTPTLHSFVEPSGVLDVYIFISKNRLRPYRKLELEIVFTSFRFCFRYSPEDRPCSPKYSTHCIYKDFFNDGYVNCPYPGCVDETKCSRKICKEDEISYGFKVAISSVIVMLLITTIVAIYLCRKLNKLCWSVNSTNYQQPHVVEINEPPRRQQPNTYVVVPPGPPEDGSLPPSYNSLFPDK